MSQANGEKTDMKDSFKTIKLTGKAYTIMLLEAGMRDNGRISTKMGKGYITGLMGIGMKEIG